MAAMTEVVALVEYVRPNVADADVDAVHLNGNITSFC